MSQVELLVAILMVSVGVVGAMTAFSGISKSIFVSKTQTLAYNLAQEKVESMKNISYYRLLVTTAPAVYSNSGIAFEYDNGNYAPEIPLIVGQISFARYVYVAKAVENNGIVSTTSYEAADSGLKQITVHVVWTENHETKQVSLVNFRNNPSRTSQNVTITGKVRDSGGTGISGAAVWVDSMPACVDSTDLSGTYSIVTTTGNWTVKANKYGYSQAQQTVNPTFTGSWSVPDITMAAKETGQMGGFAFKVSTYTYPCIAVVCQQFNDPGTPNIEFIELWNPSSCQFRVGASDLKLYKANSQTAVDTLSCGATEEIVFGFCGGVNDIYVSSGGFMLFMGDDAFPGTPELPNGIKADATYYVSPAPYTALEHAGMMNGHAGGVWIYAWDGSGYRRFDSLMWECAAAAAQGKLVDGVEKPEGVYTLAGGEKGMDPGDALERKAYYDSTASNDPGTGMQLTGGGHEKFGHLYDTNSNSADFVLHDNQEAKLGLCDIESNIGGELWAPALDHAEFSRSSGAVVRVNDNMSSAVTADATGWYYITSVETGTWTISVSSADKYMEFSSVTISNLATSTTNLWVASSTPYGYFYGCVENSLNSKVNVCPIDDSAGDSVNTDAYGNYRLSVSPGSYTVIIANRDRALSVYTEQSYSLGAGTEVVAGNWYGPFDFTSATGNSLTFGGVIRGSVTINGTDALPGMVVTATSTGKEYSAVSGSNGAYVITNVDAGDYVVKAQTEAGESCSNPVAGAYSVTVSCITGAHTCGAGACTQGTSHINRDFTIASAFATISGYVTTTAGEAITTGVLLLAATNSITAADPPAINNSVCTSSPTIYTVSSKADGTYQLRVRGGYTYNLYAWYTTFTGDTPITTPQTATKATVAGVTYSGATGVNFTW